MRRPSHASTPCSIPGGGRLPAHQPLRRAGGWERQEQEAVAARVQFEQFFTPEMSRHLATQPDLLKGRDAEVTILFCDIRRFSRVSERLGPAGTVGWIGDVLGTLSEC